MHAYTLWWKLLRGNSGKAPGSQAKPKTRTRHGTKTKSKKQADFSRRTTVSPATSAPVTGAPEHGTADPSAGCDGVVRKFLRAVGIRRLEAMTSRSRVCGNPKYKVNNQNLEKFEQLLSKIPEGEKLKGTTSLASLPERHEDANRTVNPPAQPVVPERAVPDISPSTTMGSSVTAEYELFCKAFHSEAKELLPEEEQQNVRSNPMRQLLQSASEAASRGLQLQRVTSAYGGTDSPRNTRTIDETYAPTAVAPGVLVSTAASNYNGAAVVPDADTLLADGQLKGGPVTEVSQSNSQQPTRVPSREQQVQQLTQDQPGQHPDQQDKQPQAQQPEPRQRARRWSENPVGAPVFMAKKFAEKLSKSKDVTQTTGAATEGPRRKSSASLLKVLKPKLPFSSGKSSSKQKQKSAVGGEEQCPQPSTSLSAPKGSRQSASSKNKR